VCLFLRRKATKEQQHRAQGKEGKRKRSSRERNPTAWRNPRGISSRPSGYSRSAIITTRIQNTSPTPRPRTISCTAPTILLLHYNSIHSNRYRTNTLYALLHTYSTTLTLFHDLRSSRKSAPLCQRQNTTRQIHSPALRFTPPQITLDPADQTSSRCSPSSSPSRPSSLSPSRPSP
jgi:hypothetical protein